MSIQVESRTVQPSFQGELAQLLNRHCAENASNTPDWILANALVSILPVLNSMIAERDRWYGVNLYPGCSRGEEEPGQ